MALSAQEFARLKARLGSTTSSVPATPQEQGMTLDKNPIKQFGTDMVATAFDAISGAGKKVVENADKYGASQGGVVNGDTSFLGRAKNTALNIAHDTGAVTGGVVGAIFSPVTTAVKTASDNISDIGAVQDVANSGVVDAGANVSNNIKNRLDQWSQANPEKAALIGDTANLAAFLSLGLMKSPNFSDIQPINATKDVFNAVGRDIKTVATTIGKEAKPILSKVAPTSEEIMQRVARIPKSRQQLFEKTSGESVGAYLDKRGIYGNEEKILTQLGDRFVTHRNLADTEIAKLPGKFQATPIKTALEQLIEREVKVSSPGVLSPDFKKVQGLLSRYNKEGLSMTEINEVKRLFERNVKLEFKKSLSSSPESIAKSTNLDNALRAWQFAKAEKLGLKNLGEINKETRLARQLLDDLGKEVSGLGGNNALGLTDAILVSGGDPAAIAMLITKKGFGSKTVQSKIAEILSKNKEKLGTVTPKIGAPKKGLEDFMNATPSTQQAGQVSKLPSPNSTPLSPEVKRIMNMRR